MRKKRERYIKIDVILVLINQTKCNKCRIKRESKWFSHTRQDLIINKWHFVLFHILLCVCVIIFQTNRIILRGKGRQTIWGEKYDIDEGER